MTFDTLTSSLVGMHLLDHLAFDGFATGRPLTDLSEAKLYEYVCRSAVEVSSEKWSACPGRTWPWEERVSQADGERLGRAVPACRAARWWTDPVGARPQVWLGRDAAAPTAGVLPRSAGGKPPTEIWTSSAVAGLPSAWWPVLRDGPDSAPPEGPQSIWQLTPNPDARFFEIRSPEDWQWLCETFPGPVVDGWARPSWEAAGEELDGIHLTVEGLVRAQGAQIETSRGPAMLDDWDAESTAWLRWSVVALERLGTVTAAASSPPASRFRRGRAAPRARRGS